MTAGAGGSAGSPPGRQSGGPPNRGSTAEGSSTAPAIGFVLGTTAGGTGRHVAMLARACAGAGWQVRVFGPAETRALFAADRQDRQDPIGFEAVRIADRPRPASDARALLALRRRLAATAADILHAPGLRAGALAALALPARARATLVVTVHNAPPSGARLAAVYAVLERLVARRAGVVLSVSPDLSARMLKLGARDVQRAVVAAPDPGPAAPGQVPADVGADGRPVVLGVGRLAPQKGFGTLLAAAATWRNRQPAPVVVIAGDGPLAAELASQARASGVDARFLGERDDVPGLLAAADVFVLPSRWEGQPLSLQEALRAGRPIVATDVGGVRDLTGDDAALLVPPADPAALSRAVLEVLNGPGVASRLGAAAASRAAELPTEADAAAAALDLYDRLRLRRQPF